MGDHEQQINAARTLVGAPLLISIAENAEARGDADVARAMRVILGRASWRQIGEIVISDECFAPYKMHLRMSLVPKDYVFTMDIPAGYDKAMRDKFALFRSAARAFWQEFRASLGDELRATLPESLLETETAFFARNDDIYWVGIFGYISDKRGRKYITKP